MHLIFISFLASSCIEWHLSENSKWVAVWWKFDRKTSDYVRDRDYIISYAPIGEKAWSSKARHIITSTLISSCIQPFRYGPQFVQRDCWRTSRGMISFVSCSFRNDSRLAEFPKCRMDRCSSTDFRRWRISNTCNHVHYNSSSQTASLSQSLNEKELLGPLEDNMVVLSNLKETTLNTKTQLSHIYKSK
jgi:hypothetical protein